MSAFATRVSEDIRKIELLSKETNGKIKIKSMIGNPTREIVIELAYPTAGSNRYPQDVQSITVVQINLLSRYPFQEPAAKITTPVFHPNVYTSGQICFGTKWLPTQGLDLLIKRIVKIITFDETILNEGSPANGNALAWYRKASCQYPDSFPTTKLIKPESSKKSMSWSNISEPRADVKVLVECPNCNTSLRLPSGQKGNVRCPKCSNGFYVET